MATPAYTDRRSRRISLLEICWLYEWYLSDSIGLVLEYSLGRSGWISGW